MLSFKLRINNTESYKAKCVYNGEEIINTELKKRTVIFQNNTIRVVKTETVYLNSLVEHRLLVENISKEEITINEINPVKFSLNKNENILEYFNSSWGNEFNTATEIIDKDLIIENKSGRSSHGTAPTIFIKKNQDYSFGLSVAWSGNHKISLTKDSDGFSLTAGINPWNFEKKLQPNEKLDSMSVYVCYSKDGSLDSISNTFIEFGRKYLYPKNANANKLLFEWNHWWAYEDRYVNEKNFLRNIDTAKEVGCELITLDAGWYGGINELQWTETRGDWNSVNLSKFPSGIRYISDYVHSKNMKFGLWCEIEALGNKAKLNDTNPEFAAKCNDNSLGYICFGNRHAEEWAFKTLEKLIIDYDLDWIKLDFNIDPMSGCNRTDHGHHANDGLYEHYRGYYRVLDKIREKYPHVVLENCSSGGLRTDLEMARHTHCTFLSDVDVTSSKLNFLRGELITHAPNVCLNWCWSHSIFNEKGEGPFLPFNLASGNYKDHEIEYHLIAGMMGCSGISQRLEDFTLERKEILAEYISIYKKYVKEYLRHGKVYILSPNNLIDKISIFLIQYYIKEKDSSLLYVLNDREKNENVICFIKNIDINKDYRIAFLNTKQELIVNGKDLIDAGISCGNLRRREARLIKVMPLEL